MRPRINRFIHTSYKVNPHLDRNAQLLPVSAYAKLTQSSQPSYERSASQNHRIFWIESRWDLQIHKIQ